MLKKMIGYFYKNHDVSDQAVVPVEASEFFDRSCIEYFDEDNAKSHAVKMINDPSQLKTTYVIDDNRYGIDSPLYLYLQRYAFKAIQANLTLVIEAINHSEEGRMQMLKRYGRRIMHYFPKIDTRPTTLQTTKTVGVFGLVSVSAASVSVMRFAELTVPSKICWSDSNEITQSPQQDSSSNISPDTRSKFDTYTAESVDISDEVPDAFCVTYVFGDKKQYRYVSF